MASPPNICSPDADDAILSPVRPLSCTLDTRMSDRSLSRSPRVRFASPIPPYSVTPRSERRSNTSIQRSFPVSHIRGRKSESSPPLCRRCKVGRTGAPSQKIHGTPLKFKLVPETTMESSVLYRWGLLRHTSDEICWARLPLLPMLEVQVDIRAADSRHRHVQRQRAAGLMAGTHTGEAERHGGAAPPVPA